MQLLLQGLELLRLRPLISAAAQLQAELLEPPRLLQHHLTELARRVLQEEQHHLLFLSNRELTGSYLDVLVSGIDAPEKVLDLLLVLLGLLRSVRQHFLEEVVLELEAELQLLQKAAGSRRQEGRSQSLEKKEEDEGCVVVPLRCLCVPASPEPEPAGPSAAG